MSFLIKLGSRPPSTSQLYLFTYIIYVESENSLFDLYLIRSKGFHCICKVSSLSIQFNIYLCKSHVYTLLTLQIAFVR